MFDLPLSRPDIGELERRYVNEVLASERLALGPRLDEFEEQMAHHCGTRYAVAVSSGTAALHLAVQALGIGEDDDVLTTPFSFVASSNVMLWERARLRFVDISPDTFNIDVGRVREAYMPTTRAVLAVDVFGLPADWAALTAFAQTHNVALIDDACHALGARIGERPIGSWGHAACFGFYPNKQITTGEGGCITTDDAKVAALCRSLRNQGRIEDGRMEHVYLGYNYRLSELAAALGCAQLERLPELLARRSQIAAWYQEALAPLQDDIVLPFLPEDVERSWFVYVVRLGDHFGPDARDALMHRLQDDGIGCAPYFPSIHLQPYYRRRFGFKPGDFPICERISARTLALPFFTTLTQEEVARVAAALEEHLPALPDARLRIATPSTAS